MAIGVAEQEDRVASDVGIKVTGLSQPIDQGKGEGTLLDKIAADGVERVALRCGQEQKRRRF